MLDMKTLRDWLYILEVCLGNPVGFKTPGGLEDLSSIMEGLPEINLLCRLQPVFSGDLLQNWKTGYKGFGCI